MAVVVNAMQIKSGARTTSKSRFGTLTQPLQFLPRCEKTEEWGEWCMDWFEMEGLKQIRRNAKKLLKNYKLANGIIDRADYIVDEDNEYSDLVETLTREDSSALELKFYPIIPNVINVLCGEFAKRTDRVKYVAVDPFSYNEMLEQKRAMIEDTLVKNAEHKLASMLIEQGVDPQSEDFQKAMSPENIRSLPEIEEFFKKTYRSQTEQWASHQHEVDSERFRIKELENTGFKDMLIADREFWHFKLEEDDYNIEIWNPLLTFYHKSPDVRYISQGNYVGKIELSTISDIIDKYGYLMSEEQHASLEEIHTKTAAGYAIQGHQNDGTFYDPSRSYAWNVDSPSLGFRQYTSVVDYYMGGGDDVISRILGESEDLQDTGSNQLLRETTIYWKSQQKVGHLTKIDPETGMKFQEVVTEEYEIHTPGEYNTKIKKEKSGLTLIQGEHVDWIYINHVYSGIKISRGMPAYGTGSDYSGFEAMYFVKPLKFQFKGDYSLYGCKLPVEGSVFSDRNTRSTSLVDKMKPYQVGYNLTNNQISDILIDELGTVILLDHNTLPKHSAGEDWGKHNYAKAYVAMKNFQMLPLDTSISNTEGATGFNHYQVLDLAQTERLMSRVQLSQYFKTQAFEVIGITPQRMGQVNSQETATGIEQSVNASYSQTEMYFVQHSEYLMPRVHQMRTDLAQYYGSKNPSIRLSYMTSLDEKVNFQMNGTELLSRDLNVFSTTKVNHKQILEQIKQLAIQNNTAGASIFDLAEIVKADSMAEVTHALKSIEEKASGTREQENAQEKAMQDSINDAEKELLIIKQEWESNENALDRQNNLDVAEIKGAGYQVGDINSNQETDYMDSIKYLDDKRNADETLNLKREQEINKNNRDAQALNVKREEIKARKEIAQKALDVAKENKTNAEIAAKKKASASKKK